MSTPTVAVIVTSFERKRMLRECLMSVRAARPDELIIVDDGSTTFSPVRVAGFALFPTVPYRVIWADPMTVDERMSQPRQGRLINEALATVTSDVTTLCCDDDILHPGWLDAIRAHWTQYPQRELARGDWLQFQDGDTPSLDDPPCGLDERQMTAGNFAWHSSLHRDRGILWPEDAFNCLDDGFLHNCQRGGVRQLGVAHVGAIAGWRRSHDLANGNFADGKRNHTEAFRAVLESGRLE